MYNLQREKEIDMNNTEDEARYGIPSVHTVDDTQLTSNTPSEPIPPGGQMPQLDLAQSPAIDVASGLSYQPMPDPIKPPIIWPTLSGSPDMGGYDPSNPASCAPDLACCTNCIDYTPAAGSIQPDYIVPDFGSLNVALQPYNLDAGMNFNPGGAEFAPDPDNPDLTAYNHPMGLDFYPESYSNLFQPDPSLDGDATNPDIPGGISVVDHPDLPDPQVPDLQSPQMTPDVVMQNRPGDMDPNALSILLGSQDFQNVVGVPYDVSMMTQPGSSRRSRHMDLLMDGLS
jgi:hypothetical protein